ncbi:uncharacterized protein KY384_007621 [Bacidia gigantensis]|uniref:uncharacterized protein n=1 Tax=Bacidia gigantensis TaxID=2732470 RepID=UPI001D03B46D|nr:uncharacterized protein KY384_007621 [Bacidia gigantensis]KAG8527469.1 hypothetical protein KY384_007621 [Bacidia gigantensis]
MAVFATCLGYLSMVALLTGAMGAKVEGGAGVKRGEQEVLGGGIDIERYKAACPEYEHYAMTPHRPLSKGPQALPYQRPSPHCRTFSSPLVEQIIEEVTSKMIDKDLARIFENAFPNTLDTTVRWHVDSTSRLAKNRYPDGAWEGPQSFIVTGDINAEWLRDSTNQLAQYQTLAKKDKRIEILILGAINTQAEFVIESPYCNAFQPPPPSGEPVPGNGQDDFVHPVYEPSRVFECKYELDSLAHFLALGNRFHNNTGSTAYLTPRYYTAIDTILEVLEQQSKPTFDPKTGRFLRNEYTFRRKTTAGTETLSLGGIGNPLAAGTGLIRSAFRPSDDATTFGFFIPSNAQMSVELKRTAETLKGVGKDALAEKLRERGERIEKGIWENGVVIHKNYGKVFAFEVDGYGSSIIMDDANMPSLLALPALGFLDRNDEIYQNTRKMILERHGNPYFLEGKGFSGIGGPHVGPVHAWPLSRLVEVMTSDNDTEITASLEAVRDVSRLGLVNEAVNVQRPTDYTSKF